MLFVHPRILATFAVEYLTAKHSKRLKIARLPIRYCYFSNIPLNVYFSNGCVKPLKI